MKPVSLNQLLFHRKNSTLSFFLPRHFQGVDNFIDDMQMQLLFQNKTSMARVLEKTQNAIKRILEIHPEKSHGFFLSDDLQGYVLLETSVEAYCIFGQSFHVRPLLEELFVNPEYMLVNISYYEIKIYRGDFLHLEIVKQYDFDQVAQGVSFEERSKLFTPGYIGLIPYKTVLAIKNIAGEVMDLSLFHSLPVIVTGLTVMKDFFIKYYPNHNGLITHFNDDFYEKTCVEILEKSKQFRYSIIDFYSAQFKERLKIMLNTKRVVSELSEVISATRDNRVIQLILPTETKLWGKVDIKTGEFEVHRKVKKNPPSTDILNELAEAVIKHGGKIQILAPHFFPGNAKVLAVLRSSK